MRLTLLAFPKRFLPCGIRIRRISGSCALLFLASLFAATLQAEAPLPPLLDTMTAELNRAMGSLGKEADKPGKQIPPYFLSYAVADAEGISIRAQYGALVASDSSRQRVVDVQVRVGDPKLDNTHGQHRSSAVNTLQLPITDDREALSRRRPRFGPRKRTIREISPRKRRRFSSASQLRLPRSTRRPGKSGCGRFRRFFASIPMSTRMS
jgi:hypothetical protein